MPSMMEIVLQQRTPYCSSATPICCSAWNAASAPTSSTNARNESHTGLFTNATSLSAAGGRRQ